MANLNKSTPPGYRRNEIFDEQTGEIERVVFVPESYDAIASVDRFNTMFGRITPVTVDDCLRPHVAAGNMFMVKVDIKDAFGTPAYEDLTTVIGKRWSVHSKIHSAHLVHKEGGLIQGNSISPKIFQVYCERTIDKVLKKFCNDRGIIYTRYVDDMLFSSKKKMSRSLRIAIRKIIRENGFDLNPAKDEVKFIGSQKSINVLGAKLYKNGIFYTEKYLAKLAQSIEEEGHDSNKTIGLKNWGGYLANIMDN